MTSTWPPPEPTTGYDHLPLRPRRERRRLPRPLLVAGALLVLAVILLVVAVTNGQRISDQLRVWQYAPSAAIEGYSVRSQMTDEGRFLFYASEPRVESGDAFNSACSSHVEGTGILGCYQPLDRTIVLFDVTDDRLDGLEDVVAAHEMLHAAWDRMSRAERDRLAPLLEAEAATLSDDAGFVATMDYYATAEPTERANELHSILGTEYSDLSPKLEAHYATYFTDRGALVALADASSAVFDEQAAAIQSLSDQLAALAASVDTDYANYNSGYDALNADIGSFNARADAGSFDSQAQFDAERNALLKRQADLDALYASIEARKAQYDQLLAQLDSLNATAAELNQAINIAPRESDLGG